ncbi:hypothetical protein MUN77_07695 [Leucobacter allii]|uniref:hypothetical protein n=1 Tax=Leucobacter allii TaxID=2932247 RepID=UPI001FD1B2B0|nr:hypothetical protein [Leucobacter allii]UOR03158.1 hypothetical protein MUN77_07695 [Leucobacter allii]
MESTQRRGTSGVDRDPRLRLVLRVVSVVAVIGAGAAVVWFGCAAADASGVQMAAAGATFAGVASGWSAAFAAIRAKSPSGHATRA